MRGVDAVAEILRREQVEYLFCFPDNSLIDACAALGIRPIMTRTERTLVNMADGYSRVSSGRRIGVGTVQLGPGSENAFAGVAQAYADGVPLLLLPGSVDQRRLGLSRVFDATRNYAGVTRWSDRINAPERIADYLRRAFTLLLVGQTGPVVLELPEDVAAAEVDSAQLAYSPPARVRAQADPDAVRAAVRLLLDARRPLLQAGQGVLYAEASEELRELAELLDAPVMTTLPGKSSFPENHPLALGSAGYSGAKPVADFLAQADVVFGIGTSMSDTEFGAPLRGKTLIQNTAAEREIGKDYPLACALLGDAKLVLRQVIDEIAGQGGARRANGVQPEVARAKEAWLREWMPRFTTDERPMSPYRVIWDLMRTLDRTRTIVTHDSGNPRDQIVPFWESLIPHGYIGWGKSTQLGYSLGLAMGAKLAAPDKQVVHFMGDAAFGMCGMDVETAARERIPIMTVIVNNSALGGYEQYMPIATERYGTKFLTGRYAGVATALGAYGERVEQPSEIVPAIRRAEAALADGKPAVLEMITREEPSFSKHW